MKTVMYKWCGRNNSEDLTIGAKIMNLNPRMTMGSMEGVSPGYQTKYKRLKELERGFA